MLPKWPPHQRGRRCQCQQVLRDRNIRLRNGDKIQTGPGRDGFGGLRVSVGRSYFSTDAAKPGHSAQPASLLVLVCALFYGI